MPHRLDKSGDDQAGSANTQLAEALVVLASDERGHRHGRSDRHIYRDYWWEECCRLNTDANPCIFKAAKSSITAITDTNGQATTRLTLGSNPGNAHRRSLRPRA